jgi:LuxR family maltose regulon positive regulatory protein
MGAVELGPALAALRDARWQEAFEQLSIVAAEQPTGAVLEALGEACSWLDRPDTIEVRERAYRAYRQEGDARGSARAAIGLAFDHVTFRGEPAVGQGWLELAARALEGVPLAPEHGYLAAWQADFTLTVDGDAVAGAAKAAEVVRIGRELGIADVELIGRSQSGLALVLQGRITEGMRLLDSSAAAAVAGEIVDPAYAGYALCYVINACELARDPSRAAQWCTRLDGHCRRVGLEALQQLCRSEYAGVLVEQGQWERAEHAMLGAAVELADRRPGMAGEPLVRLAELRRRQGRLDEAAVLFDQVEGHPRALLGRAWLALDRDEPAEAVALARRFLRQSGNGDRASRSQGLELLVMACAAAGDPTGARSGLAELTEQNSAEGGAFRAGARLAEAQLLLVEHQEPAAREAAEDAVDLFDRAGSPFGAARARLVLARVLLALGDETAGRREAEVAARAFDALGAAGEGARARALRRGAAPAPGPLTSREVDVLRLVADGLSTAEIAARLVLSEHTVHRHVANTLTKLDVRTRAAAVAKASSLGLV